MPAHRYLHYDVFTRRPLAGNQLAVFPEAAGLDPALMQRIALEMAFPETTFVLPPETDDTDVRMRIFTPRRDGGSPDRRLHLRTGERRGDRTGPGPARLRARHRSDVGVAGVGRRRAGVRLDASAAPGIRSPHRGPAFGIPEDPATGGASGPLGAYLVQHEAVSPEDSAQMVSLQGVKMGRPSQVHISISSSPENGDITSVQVGGASVLVAEGALYL